MKIRSGFVSNSSTSSFVIYGFIVSEELVCKKFLTASSKESDEWMHEGDAEEGGLDEEALQEALGDDFAIQTYSDEMQCDDLNEGDVLIGVDIVGDDLEAIAKAAKLVEDLKETHKIRTKCLVYSGAGMS
jgi:hypothetical protein